MVFRDLCPTGREKSCEAGWPMTSFVLSETRIPKAQIDRTRYSKGGCARCILLRRGVRGQRRLQWTRSPPLRSGSRWVFCQYRHTCRFVRLAETVKKRWLANAWPLYVRIVSSPRRAKVETSLSRELQIPALVCLGTRPTSFYALVVLKYNSVPPPRSATRPSSSSPLANVAARHC